MSVSGDSEFNIVCMCCVVYVSLPGWLAGWLQGCVLQLATHTVGKHVLLRCFASASAKDRERLVQSLSPHRETLLASRDGKTVARDTELELYCRSPSEWMQWIVRQKKAGSLLTELDAMMTTSPHTSSSSSSSSSRSSSSSSRSNSNKPIGEQQQQVSSRTHASDAVHGVAPDDGADGDDLDDVATATANAGGRKRKRKRPLVASVAGAGAIEVPCAVSTITTTTTTTTPLPPSKTHKPISSISASGGSGGGHGGAADLKQIQLLKKSFGKTTSSQVLCSQIEKQRKL